MTAFLTMVAVQLAVLLAVGFVFAKRERRIRRLRAARATVRKRHGSKG